MINNKITITDDQLIVEPVGIDKVLGFKNRLEFPLSHIRGASIDRGVLDEFTWRKAGYGGINKKVGTFSRDGENFFYNFRREDDPVVITLSDENYSRLVLSVEDPQGLVDQLNNL